MPIRNVRKTNVQHFPGEPDPPKYHNSPLYYEERRAYKKTLREAPQRAVQRDHPEMTQQEIGVEVQRRRAVHKEACRLEKAELERLDAVAAQNIEPTQPTQPTQATQPFGSISLSQERIVCTVEHSKLLRFRNPNSKFPTVAVGGGLLFIIWVYFFQKE